MAFFFFFFYAQHRGTEASRGLFSGAEEWATVVNRQGPLPNCVFPDALSPPGNLRDHGGDRRESGDKRAGGSRLFRGQGHNSEVYSTDGMALVESALYTPPQPGHSLWGVAGAGPFRCRRTRAAE